MSNLSDKLRSVLSFCDESGRIDLGQIVHEAMGRIDTLERENTQLKAIASSEKVRFGIYTALTLEIAKLRGEWTRLRAAYAKTNEEICQTLGKALGYPWFKDDQKNFPGATEEHGVCVGDHVAETLAMEAARKIEELRARH